MKIVCAPADLFGCGFYRLIHFAKHLQAQGHDITIIPPDKRRSALTGEMKNGRLVGVTAPPGTDVMVMQRVTHPPVADAIPLLRAEGVAVVVDIDDDLDAISPSNPAWAALHPRSSTEHDWASARLACERATLVTVSSPALLRRYAAHGRGVVIPNCVPELFLQLRRVDSGVIGWGGSVHSHPDDLQVVGTSMRRLQAEGHVFQVVGPGAGVRDALGLPREPLATGNVEIGDWAASLSILGVGITPLADTRFNMAKSWLKPLEKAAVGVPTVMSPRREYARIHADYGVGVLAAKPAQWYREVKRLVEDEAWRREVSERSRAGAAQWTVERNAWRVMEAWEEAFKIQRGLSSSVFARR